VAMEKAAGGQDYETLTASSGEGALAVLFKKKVDLIIIDVMMPGTNGLELLDLPRGMNLTKQIPVLLISGLAQ